MYRKLCESDLTVSKIPLGYSAVLGTCLNHTVSKYKKQNKNVF